MVASAPAPPLLSEHLTKGADPTGMPPFHPLHREKRPSFDASRSFHVNDLVITVKEKPTPEEARLITSSLKEFSEAHSETRNRVELTIVIRDSESRLLGGLRGVTAWRWLYVSHLWVEEASRNQRIGTRIMVAAEDEARRRGCRYSHLETFSFQALDFYLKLGYRPYAALEDYPPGHTRLFLKKSFE